MLGYNCPLVSVIIGAYNHEAFVQKTIQSIINQTYQNIELIVIDDGSKDQTWKKICNISDECNRRFVRFVAETQENMGTSCVFRRLLSLAQGKFIFTIASDDIAKSNAIEILLKECNHDGVVLACGDNDFIDSSGRRIGWRDYGCSTELDKAKFKTFAEFLQTVKNAPNFLSDAFGSYETLILGNYIPNCLFIKKEALNTFEFPREKILEDWFLFLQLAKVGNFKFVNQVLASYRQHQNNTISNVKKMKALRNQTIIQEAEVLSAENMKKWKDIFYSHMIKSKCLLNLGKIKVFKQKDLTHKKLILSLGTKKFTLFEKKLR